MLTRFIKIQLVLFTILTVIALAVLGLYYLRLPSLAGVGQYTLYAAAAALGRAVRDRQRDLPRHPDRQGHRRRADRERRPGDDEHRATTTRSRSTRPPTCTRSRRSASSTSTWCRRGRPRPVPQRRADDHQEHGAQPRSVRRWTRPTAVWRCCRRRRSTRCSPRRRRRSAVWARRCSGWSTSTTNLAQGLPGQPRRRSTTSSTNSAPILDSQVRVRRRDRAVVAQPEHHRRADRRAGSPRCAAACSRPPRRLDQVNTVFSDVRESLPQTLANLDRRHRHAQALPQGPRAGAGDPAAGRGGRRRPARSSRTRACCTSACRSTSRRRA